MNMKKILAIAFIVITILMMAACQPAQLAEGTDAPAQEPASQPAAQEETASAAEAPEDGGIVIGYSGGTATFDFCNQVDQGILDEAEKRGYEVLLSQSEIDPQQAAANIDTFLARGVDIIVDYCCLPDVGKVNVEKAAAQDVEVISIDVEFDGAYYFGADGYQAGYVAGQYAGEWINENWGGQVDCMMGSTLMTVPSAIDRIDGMRDAIEEVTGNEIPDDNYILYDCPDGSTLQAKNIATDYLTAHPNEKHIVLASHNDQGGQGLFAALSTQGRTGDAIVVSHNADKPFLESARKEGEEAWIGSVAYFPEKYGEYLLKMIDDILAGSEVPTRNTMDHIMVTRENIDQYYPE